MKSSVQQRRPCLAIGPAPAADNEVVDRLVDSRLAATC